MLGDRALRQDRILKRDQGIKLMPVCITKTKAIVTTCAIVQQAEHGCCKNATIGLPRKCCQNATIGVKGLNSQR